APSPVLPMRLPPRPFASLEQASAGSSQWRIRTSHGSPGYHPRMSDPSDDRQLVQAAPPQPYTIAPREGVRPEMVTTSFMLDGYRVAKNIGVVRGLVVRSRSLLGNIGASFQMLFGGNISLFTS